MTPEQQGWLRARQADLDGLIARSIESLGDHTVWERERSLNDLLNLNDGLDCCYDRPSIGVAYASWYHARRCHGALRALAAAVDEVPAGPLHLFDMGCGTGAGIWALLLLEASRLATGGAPRRLTITGVDSSPFMLEQAERMVSGLLGWLGATGVGRDVELDLRLQSWVTTDFPPEGTVIALGTFLLDWSDVGRAPDLAASMASVLDAVSADFLVMSSSRGKRAVLKAACEHLQVGGRWVDIGQRIDRAGLWAGALPQTGRARRDAYEGCGVGSLADRDPSWGDDTGVFLTLRRAAAPRALPLGAVDVRERLVLDQAQALAAEPEERLTAILGAAGSGKSRVLIERVARSLESADERRVGRNILVTTFNKDLLAQLGAWLVERCEASRLPAVESSGDDGDLRLAFGGRGRLLGVRLINWDKVPTRLWRVEPAGSRLSSFWLDRHLDQAGSTGYQALRRAHGEVEELARFLDAELDRVIYGRAKYEKAAYLTADRPGRRVRLPKDSPIRREIWQVLMESGLRDFTHVRIDAHRKMVAGRGPRTRYDEVFVDEYQDFGYADFDLVAALVPDPRRITVAGDPAQAVHLGLAAELPGTVKGARWKRHPLEGSYRMPIRLCEAVRPLAGGIQSARRTSGEAIGTGEEGPALTDDEIVLPESVKGAVLGIRPILVAGSMADVAHQIREVFDAYGSLLRSTTGERIVTVAEGDEWMRDVVRDSRPAGFTVRMESMRKIKGLERSCILWSTRAEPPANEAIDEWVYTIVTRSTCLVVIALSTDASPPVRRTVASLEPARVLFWRPQAQALFEEWQRSADPSTLPARW